jgi:hypothetical protein
VAGRLPDVRMGIDTGEVVANPRAAERGEFLVTGEPVNMAARLQQHAAPNQVLVGERTMVALQQIADLRPVSPLIVKGRDVGRSVVVNMAHCVMIGRAPDVGGATGMITQHSMTRLEAEDMKTVARHLKIRAPLNDGARALLTSFNRDPDVCLLDDAVSSRHLMIFVDEAGASMLDVASTNGTFVNGRRVTEAELALGDLIRIGETRIEVRG